MKKKYGRFHFDILLDPCSQFPVSSFLLKMAMKNLARPIHAPSCPSAISLRLPSKQYQCVSGWTLILFTEKKSFPQFICCDVIPGLYQSLRHNYFVDQHDIDAAITKICQELLPMEVDMTSFLLSSCGHMQKLVNQARRELMTAKEGDFARKHSVRFLEVVDIQR